MSNFSDVLQPYIDRNEVAGIVALVADSYKILSRETYGYSDIGARTSIAPDALFWIASQTKMITAAALMIGVDEGLFALDDPVEKYIPEFAGQMVVVEKDDDHKLLRKPHHPFTIREAMCHSSGMPWASGAEQPIVPFLTLRQAVLSYTNLDLEYEPGSRYQYTNTGINSAARVLEITSQTPFETWLQERLFDPLNMPDTTFWPAGRQLERLVKKYQPRESGVGLVESPLEMLEYPLDDKRRIPSPGGGLFSTAGDIFHFCRMILRGGEYGGKRYLSENSIKEITTNQLKPELGNYGLGCAIGEEHFGHGGACQTQMRFFPGDGLIAIYLVQHSGFPGEGAGACEAFMKAAREKFGKS